MGKHRGDWQGIGDLKYFFPWHTLLSLLGTVGLLYLQFWRFPVVEVQEFVDANQIWFFLVFSLLVAGPPIVDRGIAQLRARSEQGQIQIEVQTILYVVRTRLMYLVLKMRESLLNGQTAQYFDHSVEQCKQYLETRVARFSADRDPCAVNVYLYRLSKNVPDKVLELRHKTGLPVRDPLQQYSNAQGSPKESKDIVKRILAGENIYIADTDTGRTLPSSARVNKGAKPYRTMLAVPVYRYETAEVRVVDGMLMATAEKPEKIVESDLAILETFANLISSGLEIDDLSESMRSSIPNTSVAGVTVPVASWKGD